MSMRTVTKEYENDEYGDLYEIEYRGDEGWFSSTWEIWALAAPENSFDDDVAKCHLYPSGQVCVTPGKEPGDLESAEAVAHYWMERYSEYVRTGVFRDDGGSVDV
jgi:hypothetical protein